MTEVEIRCWREEDLEETVDVWTRSRWAALRWLEERMQYSHEDNFGFFRDVIAHDYRVWVACHAGRIVALIAIGPGTIEQLFVDPEHQGRGIGTLLLDHARAIRPEGLTLHTHQRNMKARAFYEGRGFRIVKLGVSPPPESEPDVLYRWSPHDVEAEDGS